MKSFLICFFITFFIKYLNTASFDVFLRSAYVSDVNPKYISNYSIKLKPVRRKCSVFNISLTLPPPGASYVTGFFQLYYRYTAGFRPYLLSFEFDACELTKNLNHPVWKNKIIGIILNTVKNMYASLFIGCPYIGRYDSNYSVDLNKTFSPLLPPIVVAGLYRAECKLWSSANKTAIKEHMVTGYVDIFLKGTKDYRDMDFSFLNMG